MTTHTETSELNDRIRHLSFLFESMKKLNPKLKNLGVEDSENTFMKIFDRHVETISERLDCRLSNMNNDTYIKAEVAIAVWGLFDTCQQQCELICQSVPSTMML